MQISGVTIVDREFIGSTTDALHSAQPQLDRIGTHYRT